MNKAGSTEGIKITYCVWTGLFMHATKVQTWHIFFSLWLIGSVPTGK